MNMCLCSACGQTITEDKFKTYTAKGRVDKSIGFGFTAYGLDFYKGWTGGYFAEQYLPCIKQFVLFSINKHDIMFYTGDPIDIVPYIIWHKLQEIEYDYNIKISCLKYVRQTVDESRYWKLSKV